PNPGPRRSGDVHPGRRRGLAAGCGLHRQAGLSLVADRGAGALRSAARRGGGVSAVDKAAGSKGSAVYRVKVFRLYYSSSERAVTESISPSDAVTEMMMGRQQTLQSSMYSCSSTEQSTRISMCSQQ